VQHARVLGAVVATRKVPSFSGRRLVWVQPIDLEGRPVGRKLVALDTVSAATGQSVFLVKGREAAEALPDSFNPADATIVALVDRIESDER